MKKKNVCVDLDDTLAEYDGWKGYERALKQLESMV